MHTKIIDPTLKILMDSSPFRMTNLIKDDCAIPSVFSMNFLTNFYYRKQIHQWGKIYGHLIHSLTEVKSEQYLQTRNIQIEPNLMKQIQKWLTSVQYSPYKVQLNQPDYQQSEAMGRYFPDDKNIEWTYKEQGFRLRIQDHSKVGGVNIDRQQNYNTKDYSVVQSRNMKKYILSAKHLNEPVVAKSINIFNVRILTNRYPALASKLEAIPIIQSTEPQIHNIQIEEIRSLKLVNKFANYWVTDIDNFMGGNPHVR